MEESVQETKEANPSIMLFLVAILSLIFCFLWGIHKGFPFILAVGMALGITAIILMFGGAFLGYHFG